MTTIARTKGGLKWYFFACLLAVAAGVGFVGVNQWSTTQDKYTAQANAEILAQDIQQICQTEGKFVLNNRDLCIKGENVLDNPSAPIAGPKGEPGSNGADGLNGADGAPGTNGQNGEPGTDGVDGTNGTNGIDGLNGADSVVPGPQGPVGPQGLPGPQGDPGINGSNGTDGAAGEPGQSPSSFSWTDPNSGTSYVCRPEPVGSTTFTCTAV